MVNASNDRSFGRRFNPQGAETDCFQAEINRLHLVLAVIEVPSRCRRQAGCRAVTRGNGFNQLALFNEFMSQHSSLRVVSTLGAKRNVLKRFERVALLKKRGQWKEGDRVLGLRKTKSEP
jgi:small basic protein (TIGR04137 family)